MKRILIAYASRCGSTCEIAQYLAEVLELAGAMVDTVDVAKVRGIGGYDAVILGSAVRRGNLLPEMIHFAQTHRAELIRLPVAYFDVGMTLREDTPEHRDEALSYLALLREIREPVSMCVFGGKVDYSTLPEMNQWTLEHKGAGIPEGDWRNWGEIREWAEQIVPLLGIEPVHA